MRFYEQVDMEDAVIGGALAVLALALWFRNNRNRNASTNKTTPKTSAQPVAVDVRDSIEKKNNGGPPAVQVDLELGEGSSDGYECDVCAPAAFCYCDMPDLEEDKMPPLTPDDVLPPQLDSDEEMPPLDDDEEEEDEEEDDAHAGHDHEEEGGIFEAGTHYTLMKDNFKLAKNGGMIGLTWLCMMLSNLMALPYFINFTLFPGWAYKLHFRGGHGLTCGTKGELGHTKNVIIPLTCGRLATASDEQTHFADQQGRMLGLFIGLTFGMINFFTRMGMTAQGDGLMAHFSVWFCLFIFNIASCCNRSVPCCYAGYQAIFCLVLAALMLLATDTLEDILPFDFHEMAGKFL